MKDYIKMGDKKIENFEVILLAVIFDPNTRKILIGRREDDPYMPNLTWGFPEGRLNSKEDMDDILVSRIKQKTGLTVKNLGAVFSKRLPENKNLVGIYFLCEAVDGKPLAGNDFKELKWVRPAELEKHFKTSFHPHLKEYVMNLA